jgi:hypothetical protein
MFLSTTANQSRPPNQPLPGASLPIFRGPERAVIFHISQFRFPLLGIFCPFFTQFSFLLKAAVDAWTGLFSPSISHLWWYTIVPCKNVPTFYPFFSPLWRGSWSFLYFLSLVPCMTKPISELTALQPWRWRRHRPSEFWYLPTDCTVLQHRRLQ